MKTSDILFFLFLFLDVDCGRVQPLLRGEVQYSNGSTHLGSIAMYTCNAGFRMIGTRIRYCTENGKWSDGAPKCEGRDFDANDRNCH